MWPTTMEISVLMVMAWSIQGALAMDPALLSAASSSLQAYLAKSPIATHSAPVPTATTDLTTLRAAVLAGKYTSKLDLATRNRCPQPCTSNSTEWYLYHSVDRLAVCNSTMLLDFALFNPIDDPDTHVSIAACTANLKPTNPTATNTTCQANDVPQVEVTSPLQLASSGPSSSASVADAVAALAQLQAFSTLSKTHCNESIYFAYSGSVVVGVYVGSRLTNQGKISSVIEQLSNQIQNDGSVAESLSVQLCGNRTARYSLGIFVNSNSDLSSVQQRVQSWKNSRCVTSADDSTIQAWQNISFHVPSHLDRNSSAHIITTGRNNTALAGQSLSGGGRKLRTRDTCTTVQVISGDTCASLAVECGITAAEFTTYNPSSTECSTLAVGEHVCCSAGTLPDYTPKPGSDGYCYSYLVQPGDTCSALAASYDITIDDLTSWNADTWGWNGCADLRALYNICLSSGYPPMPTNIANAVCGPQVNGTARPSPGTDLTTLNECPLNACCDIWGQCGTTTEFCVASNSTTGAPGTAAAGQNGCISNCGTSMVLSTPPPETYSIAYFEAFDWTRPCLKMSVGDIDTTAYTHIHFAFATLNADFSVNITSIASQLPFLQALSGVKRIMSFGGWAFSTDPGTYTIMRDAVSSAANIATVVSNIVAFVKEYDLDGVDWDWEYPSEPDIPGIPAGTAEESIGYFVLLDLLKATMPTGTTVSITAPASFWYLQHFPIQAMSEVLDYIVLMTYDLHGQWDYNNAYSDPGCPGGNCLRSHVNITETINALSMITKAGVPSNMIAVGVSSYGRSFQMTTPGCWTEMCTYTGPLSGATPGPCTGTAGYIADYEINSIVSKNPSAELLWDDPSYSNIMVYNDIQWVAYMNDSNKAVRQLLYEALTFLGTSDWAVDLQSLDGTGDGSSSSSSSNANETIYVDPGIWASETPVVTALPGVTLIWPPMPLPSTTTITFPLWTTTVSYSSVTTLTSTLGDGTTSTYPWYVYVSMLTVLTIPAVTTTAIPVWAVPLGTGLTNGPIQLTSSVQPEPFAVIVTPVIDGTTSIIAATQTTTTQGVVVAWGDITYAEPTQTETLGGRTTIIGGTTLPPTFITVTPNPHPTTVDSTKDPKVNPKTIVWTSGKPPGPTGLPGCKGCGLPCLLFCDSGCPFCPPGVFGSNNIGDGTDGGDNDDGDSDDDSSTKTESTSSTGTIQDTILLATDSPDQFPFSYADPDALSSLYVAQESIWNSIFSITTNTPTRTTTVTIPDVTITVTPTPTLSADCYFWDELVAWQFEIYNIEGWVTDGGSSLETQEKGCGALTYWSWVPATDTTDAYVHFYLPFFIKSGCVERAIVSAGGPKISCGSGGGLRRSVGERAAEKAAPSLLPITEEQTEVLRDVYGNETDNTPHQYTPMVWRAKD